MSDKAISFPLPNLKVVLETTPGLSQRGLAGYIGIHESNVSRLIKGKARMLTRERIKKIEEYTGKTFDYLADLKAQNLTTAEVSVVDAMRNAPPEIVAVVQAALAPYRPR